MKSFTKLIAVLLAAVMCLCVFSACAVKTDPPAEEQTPASDPAKTPDAATEQAAPASDVTLEIEVDWTDDNLAAFTALMDKFTAETGIKTEIVSVGEEIETQLKIRMASNDMPDLWVTHGWSLIRYKDFLTDLSGESWVSDISDAAAGVITDTDGKLYVLPVSIALSCICFNKDVVEAAGVDWTTLKTWADFEAACDKIRAAGYDPVIMGAKDSGNAGGLINSFGLGYFAPEDSPYHSYLAQFLDGTADLGEAFDPIYDQIIKWRDSGYFNADFLTLDTVGMKQALGAGTTAFCARTSTYIGAALGYHPDANLGLLPYPALEEGGKLSCAVGEGTCLGIWKDSENMDAAKTLLNWLAQPENAAAVLAYDGCTAGLKSTPDDSIVKKAYDDFVEAYGAENIYFDNMFDRKYMPNGMWNVLSEGAAQLLNGTDKADVGAYMTENFHSLYEEAHS